SAPAQGPGPLRPCPANAEPRRPLVGGEGGLVRPGLRGRRPEPTAPASRLRSRSVSTAMQKARGEAQARPARAARARDTFCASGDPDLRDHVSRPSTNGTTPMSGAGTPTPDLDSRPTLAVHSTMPSSGRSTPAGTFPA